MGTREKTKKDTKKEVELAGVEPALLQKKQSILPLKDEAVLRIRCWRSGSVQATEVQACALTIVPLRPNMAAGGWRR